MHRFLLTIIAAAVLAFLFNGCADDSLMPDNTERGPAAYSPDPTRHLPSRDDNDRYHGGGPRI